MSIPLDPRLPLENRLENEFDLDKLEKAIKSGALKAISTVTCHPGGKPLEVIGLNQDIVLQLISLARGNYERK